MGNSCCVIVNLVSKKTNKKITVFELIVTTVIFLFFGVPAIVVFPIDPDGGISYFRCHNTIWFAGNFKLVWVDGTTLDFTHYTSIPFFISDSNYMPKNIFLQILGTAGRWRQLPTDLYITI